MLEEYYMELKPGKRKKLLSEGFEDASLEETEQLKKLFDIRYSKDKKGEYIDNFLAQWLELKSIGGNLNAYFSEKRNIKRAIEAAHRLCLDRTDEFSEEILYREMKHMAMVYESACSGDSSYKAFIIGMGRISDKKYRDKMERDLRIIGEKVPEALGLEKEFIILSRAIADFSSVFKDDE